MKSQNSEKHNINDNRIFLSGKQLAEVLGVSAPTISEAVKNGWNCGGYPIIEWAIESSSGRIKGYEVPEFLVSPEKSREIRPNEREISDEPTLIKIKAAQTLKTILCYLKARIMLNLLACFLFLL